MATATTIKLEAGQKLAFAAEGITEESAALASKLLQENHDKYHSFFNERGFHNHIAHHLLTLFALGAPPQDIQKGYDGNLSYQRPLILNDREPVRNLHEPEGFKAHLGDRDYYYDYLLFFHAEIGKRGWEEVVYEYVFKGDERADDMLVRMHAGLIHPILHLGFGIEFAQPAIIAESLAECAVHESWLGQYFSDAEKKAKNSGAKPSKTIVQLFDDIRANDKLKNSAYYGDPEVTGEGIIARAYDEMMTAASQYRVSEDELEEKTAEMINAVGYYTICAQRPPHKVKFDFYLMHSINCSIFFHTFYAQPFVPAWQKTRLLEWTVRLALLIYVGRGSPPLSPSHIRSYHSAGTAPAEWKESFARISRLPDDGHASKLVRALAYGEKVCAKFEGKDGFVMGGDMWRAAAEMVCDSMEVPGPQWVRDTGFEEAWKEVPKRESARL